MNVCFLSKYYIPVSGGAQLFTERLIKNLEKKGINSIVVTERWSGLKGFEIINGIKVYRFERNIIKSVIRFARILKENNIDIVQQYDPLPSLTVLSFFAKYFLGKKVVLYCAGASSEHVIPLIRWLTSIVSDKIVSTSKAIRDGFHYGKDKGIMIYNGLDLEKFRPLDTRKKNIILNVGRIHPYKDQETLVRAAPIILEKFPDYKFIFVGGHNGADEYFRKLKKIVKEIKIEKSVKFIGDRPYDDMPKIYNSAKILAMPTLYESFGNIFAEAMACGIPIVAADTTCIPEIVGNSGIIVNRQNPEKFSEAIIKLMENKKLYEEYQRRGFKRAKKYGLEQMREKYNRLYLNILKG